MYARTVYIHTVRTYRREKRRVAALHPPPTFTPTQCRRPRPSPPSHPARRSFTPGGSAVSVAVADAAGSMMAPAPPAPPAPPRPAVQGFVGARRHCCRRRRRRPLCRRRPPSAAAAARALAAAAAAAAAAADVGGGGGGGPTVGRHRRRAVDDHSRGVANAAHTAGPGDRTGRQRGAAITAIRGPSPPGTLNSDPLPDGKWWRRQPPRRPCQGGCQRHRGRRRRVVGHPTRVALGRGGRRRWH